MAARLGTIVFTCLLTRLNLQKLYEIYFRVPKLRETHISGMLDISSTLMLPMNGQTYHYIYITLISTEAENQETVQNALITSL